MSKIIQSLLDVSLCILGVLLAITIKENRMPDEVLVALVVATACSACFAVYVFGLSRMFIRHPSLSDSLRLAAAAIVTTLLSTILVFAYNRLELVPRTLPPLQVLTTITLLFCSRLVARSHANFRLSRAARMSSNSQKIVGETYGLLLVGVNSVSSAIIRASVEFGRGRRVVGVLGRTKRQTGRIFSGVSVLAEVRDISRAISELEVRGIAVDKIVVCVPLSDLSAESRAALNVAATSGNLPIQYMIDDLGLTEPAREETIQQVSESNLHAALLRPYWRIKPVIDFVAAAVMISITFPFMVVGAIAVGLSMGFPVAFWQQRPGLGGHPFRVYKLRTMRDALASNGRRLSDQERASLVGLFLRRTRIDELPQLFNVLVGDMSLIGPRPLMSIYQPTEFRARLLIRPGLTGWAQVVGGNVLSAEDKAALDLWYILNASMWVDIKIIWRTVIIVFRGERVQTDLIENAWSYLIDQGIVQTRIASHYHAQ